MMSFSKAVKTCLIDKYATISGRASRSEFWWFQLFISGTSFCIIAIADAFGKDAENIGLVCIAIFSLLIVSPYLCVFVRRLHDRGHSGTFLLWALLISLPGVLLVGMIINIFGSVEGENKYGPNPNESPIDESCITTEAEIVPSKEKEEQTEEITDIDL